MVGMKLRCAVLVFSIALVIFLSMSLDAAAQQFPRLQEENLAGKQVVLPDAASGKVAVLVFGFTHASQTTTGAWAKQIRADFGKSAGFELYQLAVLEEAPRLIRPMITSGIKKGVPENERANFVPVMHNEAELKQLVAYKEPDDAYLVVLDRSGHVAFQTHGATPEPSYAVLKAKVESLLK
jgi:ATP10 protein